MDWQINNAECPELSHDFGGGIIPDVGLYENSSKNPIWSKVNVKLQ